MILTAKVPINRITVRSTGKPLSLTSGFRCIHSLLLESINTTPRETDQEQEKPYDHHTLSV